MKTYLKGIKTVAVIFLSLVLFSCQDEQIEPIDTLSTETNQLASRRTNFIVTLTDTGYTGPATLIASDECWGTTNTKQDLLWFVYDCWPTFEVCHEDEDGIKVCTEELTLQGIGLGFGTPTNELTEFGILMTKGRDSYFGDWTDSGLGELTSTGTTYSYDNDIEIWKKVGKGKHRNDEYIGNIIIGKIDIFVE